jgi:hypothetical protein
MLWSIGVGHGRRKSREQTNRDYRSSDDGFADPPFLLRKLTKKSDSLGLPRFRRTRKLPEVLTA